MLDGDGFGRRRLVARMTEGNRKWWTLGAVTASLFMTMLDVSVVNVALPAIRAEYEPRLTQLEWVVSSYLLTYATFLLTGGKLADLFGRRRIFLLGLTLFGVASLLCGLAPDIDFLIGARALQGLGAALMLPATQAIIAATFDPEERGMAYGIWAAVSGLGLALGPLIGGLLIEGIDWRWIFYINIPIALLAITVARAIVAESRDTSLERRLDFWGLLSSGVGLFALTFALIEGQRHGWSSNFTLAVFGVAAAAFGVFVFVELHQRAPMLDLSFFRDPTFAGANVVSLMIMAVMIGVLFFVSIFMQHFLRYSPIETGAGFLPMTLVFMLVAPVAGKLTDRIGGRWPITAGMAVLGVGIGLLSRIDLDASYWEFVPAFILAGIGIGLAMAPATTTVIGSVPVDKAGVGSGVINVFRQSGGAFGVAILGAVVTAKAGDFSNIGGLGKAGPEFRANFVSGYQDALVVASLIAFAGAITAMLTIRKKEKKEIPVVDVIPAPPESPAS
jgi:EmrB/QacA subfamily drug resistance transporter